MHPPKVYPIKSIKQETADIFTIVLSLTERGGEFAFLPGQFNMLYLFGFGEAAISVSGNPDKKNELVHTIRAVGNVTEGLQKLKAGDVIGVRGPFGNNWPLPEEENDVLIVAGGLGFAPLRPALFSLMATRPLQKMTFLYGARTPNDLLFKEDIKEWKERGLPLKITVDHADENWSEDVGLVTSLIPHHLPNPRKTTVLVCGPEIMMKAALIELSRFPVEERNIYLSLERNMQCAVGCCGHCLFGPVFICKDGPVFTLPQVKSLLAIKEL